jgi:hypothetical protein
LQKDKNKKEMRARLAFCLAGAAVLCTVSFGKLSGKKMNISGTVVDGTDAAIVNSVLMIDGLETSTVTNQKDAYKIKVNSENRKIGVLTYTDGILEEPLEGRSVINLRFEGSVPDQVSIKMDPGEEVIDIGINTVKKKAITGSVGKINGTKSKYASYNNIYEMIRGEVPGVQVNGTSIMIRGQSTIIGSSEPFFVVDGVQVMTIDNIQPQMVRSIQVLKGSAASMYGVRG